MIESSHRLLPLRAFSKSWIQIQFDYVDTQKPISELTFNDLLWCLRKRIFTEQVIDLVLDKINDNWSKIDQYYTAEICEWYEEAIRLIITFPFSFWDTKHRTHAAFCTYLATSQKRNLQIEQSIIDLFSAYKPQEVCWTKADADSFIWNLGIGQGMGIAGNIIEAQEKIKKLKIAILHQQSAFVESNWNTLYTEEDLLNFITDEYGEYGELLEDIKSSIVYEKKIKITPGLTF